MSEFTAETIDKVLEISQATIHEVKDALGRTARYSDKPLTEVKSVAPSCAPMVEVSTLAGFADLVRAKLEGADFPADFLIHVEDECTATLIHRVSDEYGRRPTLIKATPVEFEAFRFGAWHDQESFAIGLASRFAETEDRAYVLKMASCLTNEATSNTEDDGFTQRATIKAGLRTKETLTLKPRVDLAPYRTFPEVTQPVSPFVFRARTAGETPALMLVEADGGRWKVDAIATLKAALEAFGLGVPIIA